MLFSQDSAQNSHKKGIDEVEDLVCFCPLVLVDLFLEGVCIFLDLIEMILSQRVFRNGRECFHLKLLKIN